MPFLYEKLDSFREAGFIREIPKYISENLSSRFTLRPYQIRAFENFITYFENEKLCHKPTQTLFHMATGSGKTMIMAGLMIYLYQQGYRNFLFFVNLTNIVRKTEDNFLNPRSGKYLFAEEIIINGERVPVKKVGNFQNADDAAINICFTTTQGLHSDMWSIKENAVSINDFAGQKIVLISDEAHHLNASTKNMNNEEESSYHSWEETVKWIFSYNKDNVLLEFTATCDVKNPLIKAEYENKIVFDYPLYKFRADKYSKEIKTLRTDVTIMERAIQAVVLSQYRLKVFQDNRLNIKPVVLFKAFKIEESKAFAAAFSDKIAHLTGTELERISTLTNNETMQSVYRYFEDNNISFDRLAQELREDFSEQHCISANDDGEAEKNQIILNSLEENSNPYRAIFEVKKLDEGWDVLNLFDIVRLYETRQSGGKKLSSATISEAQLIGRGSRYCPFTVSEEQERYKRKYDDDIDNPLRVCEELYYHCQNDSRYIAELYQALKETGIDLTGSRDVTYRLKDSFRQDPLYRDGWVFVNERRLISRKTVTGLLPSVREKVYTVSFSIGSSGEGSVFGDGTSSERVVAAHTYRTTFSGIADLNYAIVQKALCRHRVFRFDILKRYFPNLRSTREFITSGEYLGDIRLEITSKLEKPSPEVLFNACVTVLGKIANSISDIEETYEGTREFSAARLHDVFKDKRCSYTDPKEGGIGFSQNDYTVDMSYRLDLSKEEWFAFDDNYGTTEEKAFVAYFKTYVDRLKEKYDKVYLVRNERQLPIYSFDGGERFEPDYVLFLHRPKADGFEQLQIFIEPKGTHLLEADKWKEDFLLQLESRSVPVTLFADDHDYRIWGFRFFNRDERMKEFSQDMERIAQ